MISIPSVLFILSTAPNYIMPGTSDPFCSGKAERKHSELSIVSDGHYCFFGATGFFTSMPIQL